VMGPASKLPLLGDWVDPTGSEYNQYTVRSSDFMPAHALNFFAATGNTIWRDSIPAMADAIDDIQTLHSPVTGLLPDFLRRNSAMPPRFQPVAAGFLEGDHDGHYDYNAGRDPWRLGTHVLLHGDARTAAQVLKMSNWIHSSTGGNPQLIRPGYLLDGTPIVTNYFTSFFAAPFAVAAMLDPTRQTWLNAVYDSVRTQQEGYYEDSVTLLCLLVMSGNFWDPIAVDTALFANSFE
jgi:endoglucanase